MKQEELLLTENGISRYLDRDASGLVLDVRKEVTSTNTLLYELAGKGGKEGYVLLANAQTAGRGRQGHSFYSPKDSGIYMSILLRPEKVSITEAAGITSMAAVAVCEAVEKVCKRQAGIKWVNDVFMDGRKVCGILTEASVKRGSNSEVEFVVLGIGVNLYPPKEGFPEEIKNIAGAAFSCREDFLMGEDGKNRLAAEILNGVMHYYRFFKERTYVSKYREKSLVTGKDVMVLSDGGEKKAHVLSIDEDCHLLVRYENGEEGMLHSGEVSIRL